MLNISKLEKCQSKTIRLLDKVSLNSTNRARARATLEKAERVADLIYAAGTAVPSAVAWIDRRAGTAARRLKSAFTKSMQH